LINQCSSPISPETQVFESGNVSKGGQQIVLVGIVGIKDHRLDPLIVFWIDD